MERAVSSKGMFVLLSVNPAFKDQLRQFGCDAACMVAGPQQPDRVNKCSLNLLASFSLMGQGGVVSKGLHFWKFCKSK